MKLVLLRLLDGLMKVKHDEDEEEAHDGLSAVLLLCILISKWLRLVLLLVVKMFALSVSLQYGEEMGSSCSISVSFSLRFLRLLSGLTGSYSVRFGGGALNLLFHELFIDGWSLGCKDGLG